MGGRTDRLAGALVVSGRRFWIAGAAAVAAIVLAVVLVVALGSGGKQAAPQRAVTAETVLSRSGLLFADRVVASVEVLVDKKRVDPVRVGFRAGFGPFSRVGIPHVARADAGRLARLVFSTELVCSTDVCLTKGDSSTRVQFPPAQVFYFPRDGSPKQTVNVRWLPLTLAGRTTPADLANQDPFEQPLWHATTDPLAVSYRISPTLLKALLFVLSGLLFLASAFALGRLLRALQARVRLPLPSALERAVRLVERTESRDDAAAKRKALELLSRELTRSGESQLALVARELAWAEPTPLPAVTQPLTLDVRRLIEQRSNGHGG